jgi:hypothetical protein
MSSSCRRFELALTLLTLLAPGRIFAVSCTTQAQMNEAQRTALVQTAHTLAAAVQKGNIAAVQALTIPKVKAQFDGIASTIEQTAPLPSSTVHVDITIPQLPQGQYALTLVHATGVKQPQQLAFLLQKNGDWQLAGFFVKPLLVAGHDSVWYWTRARALNQKGQKWNAYFYYSTAKYLSTPVDLLTSPNLDKLNQETTSSRPDGLPGEQPMTLTANGKTYPVSDLHTDGSLGGLDLVIRYTASDASDPVTARAQNLEVMKAILAAHPEVRDGFHGLWVFAEAPNQRPFGNELPMSDIH